MGNIKNLRRNPFWVVIEKELPFHNYAAYHAEATQTGFMLIIEGFDADKQPAFQKYPFPRVCRSLESVDNFRTKLRRFLRYELPARGFVPFVEESRIRKPGMYIAKINHDVPKKELVPPKPLMREIAAMSPQVMEAAVIPPFIPEETPPAPPVITRKTNPTEPVSTTKVLAVFLMDMKDLSTIIEVTEGIAQFRGSKPAPIRITGEQLQNPAEVRKVEIKQEPPPPVPQPKPVVEAPPLPNNVVQMPKFAKRGQPIKQQILDRILSDTKREWKTNDFHDLAKIPSVHAYLSLLTSDKLITRVSTGLYQAKVTLAKRHKTR